MNRVKTILRTPGNIYQFYFGHSFHFLTFTLSSVFPAFYQCFKKIIKKKKKKAEFVYLDTYKWNSGLMYIPTLKLKIHKYEPHISLTVSVTLWEQGLLLRLPASQLAADEQTPQMARPGSPPPPPAHWRPRRLLATSSWTCFSAKEAQKRTGGDIKCYIHTSKLHKQCTLN